MITLRKLKTFRKYGGDGDAWLRGAWPWQRNSMSAEDWAVIGQLINDLELVEKGLAAPAYAQGVMQRAEENCENELVLEELKRLSKGS